MGFHINTKNMNLLNHLAILTLRLPRKLKRLIVLIVDTILCITSIYFAFYLRLGEWVPLFQASVWKPIWALMCAIILSLPILRYFGLYREIFRYSGWFATRVLVKAMSLYGVIFFIVFTLIGIEGVPRTIGIIQPLLLLMLVGAVRAVASYWLSNPYRKQLELSERSRVLIYGAGDTGRQIVGALANSLEMEVVGFLDDDPKLHTYTLDGKRVYDPNKLVDTVKTLNISSILIAIPNVSRQRRNQIIQSARNARVGIMTMPSMLDLASGKIIAQDLRNLDIDDLLGRDLVSPSSDLLARNAFRKVVLVTGAGGSIGSELCRQILEQRPTTLILIEQNEFSLYQIHQDLLIKAERYGNSQKIKIVPLLTSVTNENYLRLIIFKWKPYIIYHAAAYKHVPLVEANIVEGVRNNVIGTLTMAKIAKELGVPNFVLISSDKAVRPTSVMGASKRLSEMILQAFAEISPTTKFLMVRFGNVLASSGSVVPKFSQQIKLGGPITITDFRMTRYFMTIPEAAQLVIQAGALSEGGDVILLDMGEPVKILDLALRMIELFGLELKDENNPHGDIEIKEVGIRPGEKLFEELLIEGNSKKTEHPRIFKAYENYLPWEKLELKLQLIQKSIINNDELSLLATLEETVEGYAHNNDISLIES
jgi:FlaA1/EpsC-like NDP-sugar epimerase